MTHEPSPYAQAHRPSSLWVRWTLVLLVPLVLATSPGAEIFMVFFLLGLVFWPVERAFARRAWREQDERDFQRSVVLSSEIERIVAQPRAMTMTSAGYRVALDMHLGEVARHFDSSITASVTGWLQHDLAFRGWGVGVAGQHVGLGTGRLGAAVSPPFNST